MSPGRCPPHFYGGLRSPRQAISYERCGRGLAARSLNEPLEVQQAIGRRGPLARAEDQVLGAAAAGVGGGAVVVGRGAGGDGQGGFGGVRVHPLARGADGRGGRSDVGAHLSMVLLVVERL